MNELKQKIALFIDADNAPASKFEDVLSEVAKYGVVTIRKAYGNWKNSSLKPWEELLHEYAIQPIQQYDLTKGKNASDIALVIDAMDVMYTKDIDVMCFVSSDCDFTPMVTRALAEGKVVLGFGERKAPSPFVNACSKFLFLDQAQKQNGNLQTKSKNLKSDTKLINLLRQAIEATEEDGGWAALGQRRVIETVISDKSAASIFPKKLFTQLNALENPLIRNVHINRKKIYKKQVPS